MTRINVVPVQELTRQHLIAEYRELPRIFNLVRAAAARGETPDDPRNPREYVLGTGHCRFFYPRLAFLRNRQFLLIEEMYERRYEPRYNSNSLGANISEEWWGNYVATSEALALNRARIAERNNESSAIP